MITPEPLSTDRAPESAARSPSCLPGRHSTFVSQPGEWKYCVAAVLMVALAYCLILNAFWHPGPDTAYYISVSRSLAQHGEFTFNGLPVGKIPPLWPLLLAAAMKFSASFAFLNLIPAILLIGSSGFWYYVVRRFASRGRSFAVVVLSGTLFYWYSAAMDLRSEGLFCFLFAGTLLLAMQFGEGRRQVWRVILVGLLCILMICVRWAGLIAVLPVAAAMAAGQLKPRRNRQCISVGGVILTSICAFYALRLILTVLPGMSGRPLRAGDPEAGLGEGMDSAPVVSIQAVVDGRVFREMGSRIVVSGKWISSLVWMPMFLGVTSGPVGWLTNALGWFLIFLFSCCLYEQARNRQWLWLGVLLYCGAIIVRWAVVNPRYLVPIAPLALLGIWIGFESVAKRLPRLAGACRIGAMIFVASIGLCNATLWAIDVYIARCPGFYAKYLAGETEQLIAAANYLNDRNVQDGQISVSPYYLNLGRQRPNGQGWRCIHLLTNRGVHVINKRICTGEPNEDLLNFAAKKGIKYYLYRPPVSPWRAHHFRIAWVQRILTGQREIAENPSWVLYELTRDAATVVELPVLARYPRRVPGM